jgi:hypothetical protein
MHFVKEEHNWACENREVARERWCSALGQISRAVMFGSWADLAGSDVRLLGISREQWCSALGQISRTSVPAEPSTSFHLHEQEFLIKVVISRINIVDCSFQMHFCSFASITGLDCSLIPDANLLSTKLIYTLTAKTQMVMVSTFCVMISRDLKWN